MRMSAAMAMALLAATSVDLIVPNPYDEIRRSPRPRPEPRPEPKPRKAPVVDREVMSAAEEKRQRRQQRNLKNRV